jgi:hypothetical protein
MESAPVVGNPFTTSCSDWKEGTYDMFRDWAMKQFGTKESDSDEEREVRAHMRKAKDISFDIDKRGMLILPPLSDFRWLREKQRTIRGYVGALYSQSTCFFNNLV